VVFRRWRACRFAEVTEPLCTPIAMPMTGLDRSSRAKVLFVASTLLGGLSEDTAALTHTYRQHSGQHTRDCYRLCPHHHA
jgi:hypothetical protein